MACKLVYNEDQTEVVLVLDDESQFEPEEVTDEGSILYEDPDTKKMYLVATSNYNEGILQADTVYALVPLSTNVEVSEPEEAA